MIGLLLVNFGFGLDFAQREVSDEINSCNEMRFSVPLVKQHKIFDQKIFLRLHEIAIIVKKF